MDMDNDDEGELRDAPGAPATNLDGYERRLKEISNNLNIIEGV